MSEEQTQRLNGENTFEAQVLAALAGLNNRLTSVEDRLASGLTSLDTRMTAIEGRVASLELKVTALDEKVDARLRDTRPIWESVLSRLEQIDAKFDVHAHDMLELRGRMNVLERRVPPAA
jgi:chromosome segregation ATPase